MIVTVPHPDQQSDERSWRRAWLALLAVAAALRLWDLGTRVLSHDESLHAFYSFELFTRGTYRHDPVYHGPLMYHVNAVIYYLFGASDVTARLAPALLGVTLVASCALFARWIGRRAALIAGFVVTVSPALVFYSRYIREDIFALVCTVLWIYGSLRYLEQREQRWLYVVTVSMALSFIAKETSFMFGAIIGSFLVVMAFWPARGDDGQQQRGAAHDLAALMLALVLPYAAGVGYFALGWDPAAAAFAFTTHRGGAVLIGVLVAIALLLTAWYLPRRTRGIDGLSRVTWLQLAALFWAIEIVFFTGFFTNVRGGLQSGVVGSLGYWLTQHEVERASQPWFFYMVVAGLYEFLAFATGSVALVVVLRRQRRNVFLAFAAWWTIASWVLFAWAGERMPWLLAHQILPMCLLTGWMLEPLLADLWERRERVKTWALVLLSAAAIVLIVNLFRTAPFGGRNLAATALTAAWLLRLGLLLLLAGFMTRLATHHTRGDLIRAASAGSVIVLTVLTVRAMLRLTFINYDSAAELMSYAQASADVKRAVAEMTAISERTVGGRSLEIAFDDESTWPLVWYLRDFPKARTWADNPEFIGSAPVVLVGPKNKAKAAAQLSDFSGVQYILYWWPIQDYANLTPRRIWDALQNPSTREYLWRVVFHRDYGVDPRQWPARREFELYVRNDLATAAATATPFALGAASRSDTAMALSEVQWTATQVLVGPFGGQSLSAPTSVTIAPDGARIIADGGNHRVVVLERDGTLRRILGGTRCALADAGQPGCVDPDGAGPLSSGDAQVSEPWGVAVGASGDVYVADTWNGRVLVFGADGSFRRKWGRFGQPAPGQDESTAPALYGPRGLALDHEGRLIVADTGNKRVLRFNPTGELVDHIAPTFATPQTFDEPTAIAADDNQTVLVADAWNRRIVRFDRFGRTLTTWRVPGWTSREAIDKPSIAVDDRGFVYATDPGAGRVFVFTPSGTVSAVVRVPALGGVARPTGLAVDRESRSLLVADFNGGRVLGLPLYQGVR